jgi:hypothetical protein
MKIDEYKSGDQVEVLIKNPQTNKDVWVNAEVLDKRMVYPANGSHHRPYPILIVRLKRIYCNATPIYTWIDGNIPVFVDNKLDYYEEENDEGVIMENEIRMKIL